MPLASWRAVPEINLLEGGSRGRRWVVWAGLALVLLWGLYLLQSVYQEGTTLQQEMDGAASRLKAVQGEVASLSGEISGLETELAALRERRQAAERQPQQPGSELWRAALEALQGLQSEGVRFESLQGSAGGDLTVVAVAAGVQPLAKLQGRLQEAGQPFELQSVQWGRDKEAITFEAILRVRASP